MKAAALGLGLGWFAVASAAAAAPDLAAPRAGEQRPAPYSDPRPASIARRVLVGVDLGLVERPVPGASRISYSPAPIYAAHARLELLDWFGHEILKFLDARMIAAMSSHGVEAEPSALGVSGEELDPPNVSLIQLGARAEPTWTVTPGVRLWVGIGVAWTRMEMDAFDSPDQVHVPSRVGVAVEYSAALGSTIDLIQDWLALELSMVVAWPEHQTGKLFESVQGFNQRGIRVPIGPMPVFERSHYGLIGLSLVL